MTIKLYLENIEAAYAQSFDARVVEVDNDRVVLDRTLFYPLEEGNTGTLGRCPVQTETSRSPRFVVVAMFITRWGPNISCKLAMRFEVPSIGQPATLT